VHPQNQTLDFTSFFGFIEAGHDVSYGAAMSILDYSNFDDEENERQDMMSPTERR